MKRPIAWLLAAAKPTASWAIVLGASSCADITLPERGVCGNGVVEAAEDCDGHADSRLGANLACRSCAYSCADGADCPIGWHRSADKVCNYAIGRFEDAPRSPFEFASNSAAIGDVDGDGHTDVGAFIGDGIVVRFGAGDGSLETSATYRFPVTPTGRIGVGDVSGDGLVDAVVPTRYGLGVLLGARDRTAETVAYSSFFLNGSWEGPWLFPWHVIGIEPQAVPSMLRRESDGTVKLGLSVFPGRLDGDETLPGVDGHGTELLGTRIPIANLDSDPATDEVVLAFTIPRCWCAEPPSFNSSEVARLRRVRRWTAASSGFRPATQSRETMEDPERMRRRELQTSTATASSICSCLPWQTAASACSWRGATAPSTSIPSKSTSASDPIGRSWRKTSTATAWPTT